VLIGNLCIAHMTVSLGGFTSAYFNGLNLVFLAAAVIVPISWHAHLSSQAGTLVYYYGINLVGNLSAEQTAAAVQNSFFLMWTCVACLFSVSLYEKLQTAEFHARLSERRTRQELEVSHRKLLDLDKLKDQFFANISHEFRSPLTVALGAFTTLLNASLPIGSHAVAQSGLRNTSRLLFLVNELLELAKFDSGQAGLRSVSVDFAALLKNVAANFEVSDRTRVHIAGAEQPVYATVDMRKMTKVLYNLLTNAFKFSDPGKGMAWIGLSVSDGWISLQIRDNGIGIPEDQLERIFERFTQVESDLTRRFEGSGIGLALAREIVALHGGTITVQSTLGAGSTFTVTLPAGDARPEDVVPVEEESFGLPLPDAPGRETAPPPPVGQTDDIDRPMILLADDNADMRAYLKRILEEEYQVVTASDGADALEKVRRLNPELVLADIMMPVMSGYDLLRELRTDEPVRRTPVILLTAKAGTDARVESFEAGADDYVSKPFNEEELIARVKNQLRIHRQERELQTRTMQLQELYSQLEAVNRELREASIRKSEFVSIVSHDLRTPLTAMDVLIENMRSGIGGGLTQKQLGYLERIKTNIDRMVRMITDLLDLSKIEAGTMQLRTTPVTIVDLAEAILEHIRPMAQAKSLNLRLDPVGRDCVVEGDLDRLSQVLTNLIHNACKFTPTGGEICVDIMRDGSDFARVCVADTGCGIPTDELPRVFDKFYRGSSATGETRGAGLGLAIVKQFVELHRGRIWVESVPQSGSRFYFTIPLARTVA
jgi:signal transduction histidine kinase